MKKPSAADSSINRFNSRFKTFLRRHGTRNGSGFGSSTLFTDPTWNIAPELPLELIADYAEQDLDRMEKLEAEARRESSNALRRTRRALARDPDLVARFNEAHALAVSGAGNMENHNYLMEQGLQGALRDAIHLVGEALHQAEVLDSARDVFHLHIDELKDHSSFGLGPPRGPIPHRS